MNLLTFPNLLSRRLGVRAGGGGWQDVPVPDAAFAFVPFTIQQNGRSFRPDPTWDMQTHANISVTGTYYVDKGTGNDGNTGASWAQALKTLGAALGKADVNRVYIRNGVQTRQDNSTGTIPARDVEIIGDGTAIITTDVTYRLAGAWTLDTTHYENTVGASAFVAKVYDMSRLDAYGHYEGLVSVASEALCEATAGSFYFNYTAPNSTIMVHLSDGRAPDSDVILSESNALYVQQDNRKVYLENLVFIGNLRFLNGSSTGGTKAYLKNCTTQGPAAILAHGIDEFIMQDVVGMGYQDTANYDLRNTRVTKAIEIDCTLRNTQTTTSDHQASTSHQGCYVVRLNGMYGPTAGQNIADVTGAQSWNLGCYMNGSSVAEVSFYHDGTGAGSKAWLDSCDSVGNTTGIQNTADSTVYYRSFVSDGTNSIAGTLTAY